MLSLREMEVQEKEKDTEENIKRRQNNEDRNDEGLLLQEFVEKGGKREN
jgi:hypothetical protein